MTRKTLSIFMVLSQGGFISMKGNTIFSIKRKQLYIMWGLDIFNEIE